MLEFKTLSASSAAFERERECGFLKVNTLCWGIPRLNLWKLWNWIC